MDITSQVFPNPPQTLPTSFPDGLLDVGNFTLRRSALGGAQNFGVTLDFVPNPDNTPVIIRSTGNVTIDGITALSVAGTAGAMATSFVRGAGGAGGPGGYRGGDGGTGGILSPAAGSPGAGPGGGPGGGVGGSNPPAGAKFFTTGTTVGGTVIPAGNDVVTLLRGGSGGGGGGGAILIAADGTITVNGTVTAKGGANGCCFGSRGSGGTGGIIRLVASTIAGTGTLNADNGCISCSATSEEGIIRSEAFTLSFTGTLLGNANVTAFSEPGPIVLPSAPTAFIQFATLTDTSDIDNTVTVTGSQDTPGRTGILNASGGIVGQTQVLNAADVTMPNQSGPASSVTVDLIAGPNTVSNPFPALKTVTLVVTPLDPAQGGAANSTATITCPAPGAGNCTARITDVTLPLGFSSMSAFTVISIDAAGALARMFPKMYEGEPIESVRIQTSGQETEYVLIAASGREFPYKPGVAAGR